jgi:8-oxo-dGTP diphosphatase
MNNPHKRTADNPVLGVLGIIREGERVLMIQRSATVRVPFAWCFPGGSIEAGETQIEALVREMQEELAIEVTPGELLMTQTKYEGRLVLYCWSATILSGTPMANPHEVAEFRWMTPAEVRAMEGVLPGTTDILEAIGL